jgi:predicted Rossmann-fold nucleotide-binding protein
VLAPPPATLYTPAELYEGWDPHDPQSAARTLDFRVYRAARANGLRVPSSLEVAHQRADHDTTVSWLLNEQLAGERVVAIMGGHSLTRNEPAYRLVAELAHRLASAGVLVLTGGGPGAMEAAHLGARLAGPDCPVTLDDGLASMGHDAFPFRSADELFGPEGDVVPDQIARLHRWQAPAFALAAATAAGPGRSTGIPTWLYGHEPPTPLATHHAKYFENSIREDGLLTVATGGVVFAPGRAGTIQEVFQDAAQNYYARGAERFNPMVFLDLDEFWTVEFNVRTVLERLLDDTQESNLHWVTSAEAAAAVLVGRSA